MDDFNLPSDLKDDVEVIYLDDDEEVEEMEDYDEGEEQAEEVDDDIDVDVVDMAKLTFSKHTKSVFAADLSKDGTLAITGGQDDMAYLWRVADGEVLLECTGHKDSVNEVCFNHDDQLVATGDMRGLLQVWNVAEAKLVWCYEGDDLQFMQWHHMTNVLITGTRSGNIFILQVPQGTCKVLSSGIRAAQCGKLLPDGKRLIVGYADCFVRMWDIKSTSILWEYKDRNRVSEPEGWEDANYEGMTSVEVNEEGTLAVLSPNGNVSRISDCGLVTDLLIPGEDEVEVCCFNSELKILVAGALSGQICVWDTKKFAVRHQAKINNSITKIAFVSKHKVAIGANDGAVYVCDVRTGTLSETLTGHKRAIFGMSVSKNAGTILTTSDDCTAKIFSIKSD